MDKQARNLALLTGVVSIGALIYMVKASSSHLSASSTSNTPTPGEGFVAPLASYPFAAAMGMQTATAQGVGNGSANAGAGAGWNGSTSFPPGQSPQGKALFPYFGYAVGSTTTSALASVEQALIGETNSYNTASYMLATNKGGSIFGG
jgi:hypothetical protein